ncbi:MAG TPA: GIY-YIG nuclease family protein [Bacteroidia bacterium]|nr:GIY-YIG nuclease family protein [Bacteroidia bacterium]
MENWYVYMAECADATFYIGTTNNVEKRLEKHNKGKGAKYTKGRTPLTLKYVQKFVSRAEACKNEYQLKQLSKTEKIKLARLFQDEKIN